MGCGIIAQVDNRHPGGVGQGLAGDVADLRAAVGHDKAGPVSRYFQIADAVLPEGGEEGPNVGLRAVQKARVKAAGVGIETSETAHWVGGAYSVRSAGDGVERATNV